MNRKSETKSKKNRTGAKESRKGDGGQSHPISLSFPSPVGAEPPIKSMNETRGGYTFSELTQDQEQELLKFLCAAARRSRRSFDEKIAIQKIDWSMNILRSSLPRASDPSSAEFRSRSQKIVKATDQLLEALRDDSDAWLAHFLSKKIYIPFVYSELERLKEYYESVTKRRLKRGRPVRKAETVFVSRLASFCKSGVIPLNPSWSDARQTQFEQLIRKCFHFLKIEPGDVFNLLQNGLVWPPKSGF